MRAVEVLPQHREMHAKLADARDWLLELHRLNTQEKATDQVHATWDTIRRGLSLDLDEDEAAAFNAIETALKEDGRLEEAHFKQFLNALDTIHDDMLIAYTVRPLPARRANKDARDFESQLLETLRATASELRERRLGELRSFIYAHPGHYVWDIYRRVAKDALFDVSYTALHSYVRELENRGDVLTIGLRQGIKRYCFPHPSRVDNRAKYFGQLFPVAGTVEKDVTDDFTSRATMARVYVVNHMMAPIAVVTPSRVNLPSEVNVEGFGPLLPWSMLESKYGIKAKVKPPAGVQQAVMIQQLEYESEGEAFHVQVSKEFLGS